MADAPAPILDTQLVDITQSEHPIDLLAIFVRQ
jgi:hypothetical protein